MKKISHDAGAGREQYPARRSDRILIFDKELSSSIKDISFAEAVRRSYMIEINEK